MKFKKMALLVLIAGGILSVICSGLTHAGAAYIYEFGNPTDTVYAGAGLAGRANNAGTVFTNPAGMTRFKESKTLVGITGLYLHAPFNPDKNTTVTGKDGDTSELFGGATFAYIYPVSDDLRLGVSMQNYFGLLLDWQKEWVGRYESTEVTLIAPQLQPTAAYRVTDWLSIGADAGLTLGYLHDEAKVNNLKPGVPDGSYKLSDTDFAVQGNFGIMIEPSEGTRFGLGDIVYRGYISPAKPGKFIWGVGPELPIPSGMERLTSDQWSLGPAVIGLTMPGHWVIGALVSNVWSIYDYNDAKNVNALTAIRNRDISG